MGIARFYRWLSERYPLINENITAEQIPEFDNLYLDMNGIIHNCSHNNTGGLCVKDEADVFVEAFKYITRLVNIIQPKKLLYMAVDGCAPRAKMNQQRSRRFRAANEAREDREKKLEMGEEINGTPFDSNCITPGTEFMSRLTEHLNFFVKHQIQEDPVWQGVTVVLSGPDVPGEGEHKIMDYIRTSKSQPGFDPNTRHCLYGLDADLIMLALASHEPHFALLREEVVFGRQETKSIEQRMLARQERFQLLHISLLREYLQLEFQVQEQLPFAFNIERIIDDFILFCVLVGNDFLPHLPFAEISDGGLGDLFSSYKAHLRTTKSPEPWLVKNCGHVDFDHFADFLLSYAVIEDDKLSSAVDNQSFVLGKRRLVGPSDAPDPSSKCPEEAIQRAPSPEHARVQYYDVKFQIDINMHAGTQQQRHLFQSFLEGVQWVLYYYFRGPDKASWSWYYPYYHAPMIYDLVEYDLLRQPNIKFDIGKPFLPFQQLMAVYPAYSKRFLPLCYQCLFDSPTSPILNFYPQKFEIDIDGVKVPWGGVTMIPFIDPQALLSAMAEAEHAGPALTPTERRRNAFGDAHSFHFDSTRSTYAESPMPRRFPSLSRCPVRVELFHHPKLLDGATFINDLLVGCEPHAPGFPTLRRHPLTCSQGSGIKVFAFEARDKSLIVHLHPPGPTVPPDEDIRALLNAPVLRIDYPFVHKGKVVAVYTPSAKYLPTQKVSCNPREYSQWLRELVDNWRRRGLSVDFDSAPAGDIAAGRVRCEQPSGTGGNEQWCQPIAEVRALEGAHVDNDGQVHYTFKATPEYRLLHLLGAEEEAVSTTCASLRSGSQRFAVGTRVVCIDKDSGCFGHVGIVTSSADAASGLKARFEFATRSQDEVGLRQQLQQIVAKSQERIQWHDMQELQRRVQLDMHSLKQILGSLMFRGAENVREDVGMCLMCEAKGDRPTLCLPNYSIKRDGQWMFSSLAVEALKAYMAKFPVLFKTLKTRRNLDRDVDARDVFWDSADMDYSSRQLVKYCNGCTFKKLRLVPARYMAVETKAITEIVNAVDQVLARSAESPAVEYVSDGHRLHQAEGAGRPAAELLLSASGDVEVGQRGVFMKAKGVVPVGTRCTVIAVYAAGTETTLEVVLDRDSFGANDLQGRAPPMRGLQIPATTLMPLVSSGPVNSLSAEQTASAPELGAGTNDANDDASALLFKLLKTAKASADAPAQTSKPKRGATSPRPFVDAQGQPPPQTQRNQQVSTSTGRIQGMLNAQFGAGQMVSTEEALEAVVGGGGMLGDSGRAEVSPLPTFATGTASSTGWRSAAAGAASMGKGGGATKGRTPGAGGRNANSGSPGGAGGGVGKGGGAAFSSRSPPAVKARAQGGPSSGGGDARGTSGATAGGSSDPRESFEDMWAKTFEELLQIGRFSAAK